MQILAPLLRVSESIWPEALHMWCLWHIHQNLRSNLGSKLNSEYNNFAADFRHVQQHMSKKVFWKEYALLKDRWPEAVHYLDQHLTPNVSYWAGYRVTRFSTGAVSTQRGEGLNRHFKEHLTGNSPLSKVFDAVILQEAKEDARLVVTQAKDEVSITRSSCCQ